MELRRAIGCRWGFTLIELIIVIAIIRVFAGATVPSIINYLGDAEERAYNMEKKKFQAAVVAYYSSTSEVD